MHNERLKNLLLPLKLMHNKLLFSYRWDIIHSTPLPMWERLGRAALGPFHE